LISQLIVIKLLIQIEDNILHSRTASDIQQRQQQLRAARAAQQHGCVGRHVANRNEMSVSGSDSSALLLLLYYSIMMSCIR